MSTKAKQQLPKWFNGQLYEEGDIVENPYSGESIELNNIELSMYDFIMGATMVYEMGGLSTNGKLLKELQDGLRWFRINNPKAYMVLLD
tara:strand:- start:792 stop:1058 length:267 start_codon:yes stop_codon:yes gene_type:complete